MNNYATPKNLIPKYFLLKRHSYVRSILKNSKVLDIGCGSYKIIHQAVGFDWNPLVLPDVLGNALSMPFADQEFDTVTALEIIEHFSRKNQHVFLSEISRVLKKHGQFIVSTPNITEGTRKLHDTLWFVSHFIYARKDLGQHIGELTHYQLKWLLDHHQFTVKSDKAFSIFNYVVEAVKS